MNYVIDKEKGQKAYIQLYENLRSDIISGVFPFGSKLPSKRTLADECGISVVTAEHSLALLCDEGYIEPRERSGYFVIFSPGDLYPVGKETATHHLPRKEQYPAHSFPFSVMAKTMRRVLTDYGEDILIKSPNCGVIELREALAAYLSRSRGIKADPECIIIGSGAEYMYGLIVSLLGRERTWGIEEPSYEKIEKVYRTQGVNFQKLPLGQDGISSSALRQTTASVLHISPFRSFPSGVTASASKRREYIRWADDGERFIVEDDFESEFTLSKKAADTVFSLAKKENVIYLNTFSQTISPSLRVGYMVLPPALAKEFKEKIGFYSCTVPAFEQYVLAELITSGAFERHINRVRRARRKAKG